LVGSKQRLITEKDKTGKFGRILGKFLVHDVKEDREMHLGQIMIREHQAVAYFGQSKEDIGYEHIKNREFITIEE
jgi:hypothetical protein